MALDSDAHNADASLHVEFYERDEKLPDGSLRTTPFCRIIAPGDQTQVWDQPAREHDKQRFPRHWLAFQMGREGGESVIGTPLKQWNADQPDLFNENQMIEMQALRFQSVEQIARMSDSQMQRVGMGAQSLKVRATQYLESKNRSADHNALADTKKQLEELQRQMAELLAAKHAEAILAPAAPAPTGMTPAQERMAKARGARKVNVGGEQHASPVGAANHG